MSIATSIEKIVRHVLGTLDSLTVNRISSRARHPLLIENGAGASIKLTGTQVIINGSTTTGGTGGALGCLWAEVADTPAEELNQLAFKDDDDWGYYVGVEIEEGSSLDPGYYCHGYLPDGTNGGGTPLVTESKLLPGNDLTKVLVDRHIILRFYRDQDYIFEDGWSLHYNWTEFEEPEYNAPNPYCPMTLSNMDDSVHLNFNAYEDTEYVYRATVDGVADFPVIALKFGSILANSETCFIELMGLWQVSTSYYTDVNFNGAVPGSVYLETPQHVDMQNKNFIRVNRIYFNSETYIGVNDLGHLTLHVGQHQGIAFERDA